MTRILVVDDNEHVRKLLKNLLHKADPSFVVCGEAADGSDAIVKAGELKPDIIILDLAMPVMNGLAAAREISKTGQQVAMFMYTLHNSAQLEAEAGAAGIRGIVAKPAAADLVALVREAVQANATPDCA